MGVLEDDLERTPQRLPACIAGAGHGSAVDRHGPSIRRLKAKEQAADRAFPRPAFTDQADDLILTDRDIHVVDGNGLTSPFKKFSAWVLVAAEEALRFD